LQFLLLAISASSSADWRSSQDQSMIKLSFYARYHRFSPTHMNTDLYVHPSLLPPCTPSSLLSFRPSVVRP
jgi:hypothetical protein